MVIAHAVRETGRREIIGLHVGAAETEAFWREFLRSLVGRGLVGVQLVISDAHPGLKAALAQVLGAPWQRCTVHFVRDLRGHVRRDQHDALGAIIRSIFTTPDGEQAHQPLREAVAQLERRLPKIAAMLDEAEVDVLPSLVVGEPFGYMSPCFLDTLTCIELYCACHERGAGVQQPAAR